MRMEMTEEKRKEFEDWYFVADKTEMNGKAVNLKLKTVWQEYIEPLLTTTRKEAIDEVVKVCEELRNEYHEGKAQFQSMGISSKVEQNTGAIIALDKVICKLRK